MGQHDTTQAVQYGVASPPGHHPHSPTLIPNSISKHARLPRLPPLARHGAPHHLQAPPLNRIALSSNVPSIACSSSSPPQMRSCPPSPSHRTQVSPTSDAWSHLTRTRISLPPVRRGRARPVPHPPLTHSCVVLQLQLWGLRLLPPYRHCLWWCYSVDGDSFDFYLATWFDSCLGPARHDKPDGLTTQHDLCKAFQAMPGLCLRPSMPTRHESPF
jgi:hypothetical protein